MKVAVYTDDGFDLVVSPKLSSLTVTFLSLDEHRRFEKPLRELSNLVKDWSKKYLEKEQPNVEHVTRTELIKPDGM